MAGLCQKPREAPGDSNYRRPTIREPIESTLPVCPTSFSLGRWCGPQPPLCLKEVDYGVLKRRLVRRGMMVAFTFRGPCGWDGLEQPGDLLVCGIGLPIEYQDWYVHSLEGVGRQSCCDRAANDGCQHLATSSTCLTSKQVTRRPARLN